MLTQPTDRERLGRAARALVERRYSWTQVTNVLEKALIRAAHGHSVDPQPVSKEMLAIDSN